MLGSRFWDLGSCASSFGSGIRFEGVTFLAGPSHCLVTQFGCSASIDHDRQANDGRVFMPLPAL